MKYFNRNFYDKRKISTRRNRVSLENTHNDRKKFYKKANNFINDRFHKRKFSLGNTHNDRKKFYKKANRENKFFLLYKKLNRLKKGDDFSKGYRLNFSTRKNKINLNQIKSDILKKENPRLNFNRKGVKNSSLKRGRVYTNVISELNDLFPPKDKHLNNTFKESYHLAELNKKRIRDSSSDDQSKWMEKYATDDSITPEDIRISALEEKRLAGLNQRRIRDSSSDDQSKWMEKYATDDSITPEDIRISALEEKRLAGLNQRRIRDSSSDDQSKWMEKYATDDSITPEDIRISALEEKRLAGLNQRRIRDSSSDDQSKWMEKYATDINTTDNLITLENEHLNNALKENRSLHNFQQRKARSNSLDDRFIINSELSKNNSLRKIFVEVDNKNYKSFDSKNNGKLNFDAINAFQQKAWDNVSFESSRDKNNFSQPKSKILAISATGVNNNHDFILSNEREYYDDSLISRIFAIEENKTPGNNTFFFPCSTSDSSFSTDEAIRMYIPDNRNNENKKYLKQLKDKFNHSLSTYGKAMIVIPFSDASTYVNNGIRLSTGVHWTLGVVEISLSNDTLQSLDKFNISYGLMDSFASANINEKQRKLLLDTTNRFIEKLNTNPYEIQSYVNKHINQKCIQKDVYICGGIVIEFMKNILRSGEFPQDNAIFSNDPHTIRNKHLQEIQLSNIEIANNRKSGNSVVPYK